MIYELCNLFFTITRRSTSFQLLYKPIMSHILQFTPPAHLVFPPSHIAGHHYFANPSNTPLPPKNTTPHSTNMFKKEYVCHIAPTLLSTKLIPPASPQDRNPKSNPPCSAPSEPKSSPRTLYSHPTSMRLYPRRSSWML